MTLFRLVFLSIFLFYSTFLKSQETIQVDIKASYKKGIELMHANQYGKALRHIYECHRSDYENIDYLNRLGYCYFKLGNYLEAKYAFEDLLKKDSTNISALSNLASIAERELNYNNARDYYGKLIQLDSTNSYYFRQSALVALKRGDPLVATAFFSKAHSLNEEDIATITDLASAYLELKAFDYADTIIEKGMAKDSSNIKVLYTYARVRNAFDDYPAVIRSVRRAMEIGDSTNYYAMMISVAYLKTDQLDSSIYHLNRIIANKRDSEHTHHYLALAYELKGEFEQSIIHFETAIEKAISKKVPRYHEDLAKLYESKNDFYKAYINYKAAYDYKPDDPLLFHIAHNADQYYKDKSIAMRYYKKYLKTSDTKYKTYADQRLPQLKELIHQMKN